MGALTGREKIIMARSGFLVSEIAKFDSATTRDGKTQDLNFNAVNFQAMIKRRKNWVDMAKKKGWNGNQISDAISNRYKVRKDKLNPFDLLQAEASPSSKNRRVSQYQTERRVTKRKKLGRKFGALYLRKVIVRP